MDKGFDNTPVEDQQTIPLALMQKWLRDARKLDLIALPYTLYPEINSPELDSKKWIWMIYRTKSSAAETDPAKQLFNSYEEALLAGIAEALTLLP